MTRTIAIRPIKPPAIERSDSFSAFQPKVTLTEKFDATQLAYATYSTGFRSGGFNGVGQLDPFKKELVRNFELGYKSSWLDQRLMFNVAAFLERDTGFQFFYVDLERRRRASHRQPQQRPDVWHRNRNAVFDNPRLDRVPEYRPARLAHSRFRCESWRSRRGR